MSMPRWLSAVVWLGFVVLGFAGCLYIAWSIAGPLAVTTLATLGLVALLASRVAKLPQAAVRPPEPASRGALVLILALGVAVRIAWVVAFPPQQFADGADYVRLAKAIADGREYQGQYAEFPFVFRAFRPPGYPAFLAPFYAVLGDRPWIPALGNLLLYLGSAILLYRLGARLSGPRAGRLAALLLTVWPGHVLITGMSVTETLSLFLHLAFYACWLRVLRGGTAWIPVLGLLGAAAAFVRPTLFPIPLLLLAFAAFLRPFFVRPLANAAVAGVIMALLIAPWAIRNHRLLGGFVPISTNGGDVFYRANNPEATGDYTERGELDPWDYAKDEVGWNKAGYRLGLEWIAENPRAFLALALKKQEILIGSDHFAPNYALKRGCGITDGRLAAADAVCNLSWCGFWLLALLGAIRVRDSFCRTPAGVAALLMILVLVAAHSIFESFSRHHVPFFGQLALLAAFLFHPPAPQRVPREASAARRCERPDPLPIRSTTPA